LAGCWQSAPAGISEEGTQLAAPIFSSLLGRAVFSGTENGLNCDAVETVFDSFGRAAQTSMPYTTSCTAPGGGSQFSRAQFDALGRPLKSIAVDGSTTNFSYQGPAAETTDSKGITRIRFSDGLGRLADVCEVSGQTGQPGYRDCGMPFAGSGFLTTYTYSANATGPLTTVNQSGQTRSFTSDDLGRLISETNPESGTTAYTFDSATDAVCGGTSTSPGDLILTADAAGLKTCASYDSLHRVVRKGLSSGDVDTFAWDASGASNKGIGRLASAANSAATDSFTWTAVGQPATVTEEVSGLGTYTSRYSYDQTGQQTQSVGPTGFTMNAAYDLEARLASISNPAGGYFLANRSFSPGGQVLGQSLGVNGGSTALAEWLSYNNMLQPFQMEFAPAGGGGMTVQYQWGAAIDDSGNVTSADNNGSLRGLADLGASGRSQTYAYDDLGRISSAGGGDGLISASFTIDPLGNRNQQSGTLNEYFPSDPATNRVLGFSYDAAGRMLAGTFGTVAAQRGFTWDPSGQMLSYSEGGTLVQSFWYDAFGRRVRAYSVARGSSTFYLYGSGEGSHPVAEYTYPNWQNNVLIGGAVVATVDASGNVRYLAADMLGTTRQTELNLASASDATRFFPYGEEQHSVSAEYLWTGQMRDANGLDHFAMRTYAPALGRWLTPDPAGLGAVDPNDPQTWNRYAYVQNNPASTFDLLGLDDAVCNAFQNCTFEVHELDDNLETETATNGIGGDMCALTPGGCAYSPKNNYDFTGTNVDWTPPPPPPTPQTPPPPRRKGDFLHCVNQGLEDFNPAQLIGLGDSGFARGLFDGPVSTGYAFFNTVRGAGSVVETATGIAVNSVGPAANAAASIASDPVITWYQPITTIMRD